jgi:hypothetical protein
MKITPISASVHPLVLEGLRISSAPPTELWANHTRRNQLEIPLWTLSQQQMSLFSLVDKGYALRMSRITNVFMMAYNIALQNDDFTVEMFLSNIEADMRGFAFEGVAMAYTVREVTCPQEPGMLDSFLLRGPVVQSGLGYLGLGIAFAHLDAPVDVEVVARQKNLRAWWAFDGVGFWRGRRNWAEFGNSAAGRGELTHAQSQIYDMGLGRAGWFRLGCALPQLFEWTDTFSKERQPDIWHGIGLAATFSGEVGEDELGHLKAAAVERGHQASLSSGSAAAAWARVPANLVTNYTKATCALLAGMSPEDCYEVYRTEESKLRDDAGIDSYLSLIGKVRDVLVE